MRWTSTLASRRASEITIASMIETVAFSAVSCGLVWLTSGRIVFWLVSATLAPLLLLQSYESILEGKQRFDSDFPENEKIRTLPIYVQARAVVIRVSVTLRHLKQGMIAIPENWFRVVFCSDFACQLELVPSTGPISSRIEQLDVASMSSKQLRPWYAIRIAAFLLGIIGLFGAASHWSSVFLRTPSTTYDWLYPLYALSLFLGYAAVFLTSTKSHVVWSLCGHMFRYSVKSTAIFWLPLLWVSYKTFDNKISIEFKLKEAKTCATTKPMLLFSSCVICLFAVKLIVLPSVIEQWNSLKIASILNVYIMPNTIHTWHCVSVFNAALALLLYYKLIDVAPRRLRSGVWKPDCVRSWYRGLTIVSGCCSMYTIFIGLLLTWRASGLIAWPNFDFRILP